MGNTKIQAQNLIFWDKQVNETTSNTEVKYKGKDNRFYFLRALKDIGKITLGSEELNSSQNTNGFSIADYSDLKFTEISTKWYKDLRKILNESRLHEIDLVLNEIDINEIDFDALYYFKQEQQYYLLDKLTFKEGKISKGNFIRVKYSLINDIITIPCNPSLISSVEIINGQWVINGVMQSNVKVQYSVDYGVNWLETDNIYHTAFPIQINEYATGVVHIKLVAECNDNVWSDAYYLGVTKYCKTGIHEADDDIHTDTIVYIDEYNLTQTLILDNTKCISFYASSIISSIGVVDCPCI